MRSQRAPSKGNRSAKATASVRSPRARPACDACVEGLAEHRVGGEQAAPDAQHAAAANLVP